MSDPRNPKYTALPPQKLQAANERRNAQVIVLATPNAAAASSLSALGDLSDAIVIDCTNPLAMGPGGLHLAVGYETSGAERIAAAAPRAAVFKALNQTGAENIADARAYHPQPVMFVAGDSDAQKPLVLQLVSELGFEAIDAGPLSSARLLEPLAMLWIELAMKRGQTRDFALALVRRARSSPSAGVTP